MCSIILVWYQTSGRNRDHSESYEGRPRPIMLLYPALSSSAPRFLGRLEGAGMFRARLARSA
jgi:hypothetical protein